MFFAIVWACVRVKLQLQSLIIERMQRMQRIRRENYSGLMRWWIWWSRIQSNGRIFAGGIDHLRVPAISPAFSACASTWHSLINHCWVRQAPRDFPPSRYMIVSLSYVCLDPHILTAMRIFWPTRCWSDPRIAQCDTGAMSSSARWSSDWPG